MKILIISLLTFWSFLDHYNVNEVCNTDKIYATKDYLYGDSFFSEYDKVNRFPTYEGGKSEIEKFFKENVVLSGDAKKMISRFHITFIVNCEGKLCNFKLNSSPFPGHEEIMKACKKMPKWNSTKVKGEFVDCYVRLGFTNQVGNLKVDYREK